MSEELESKSGQLDETDLILLEVKGERIRQMQVKGYTKEVDDAGEPGRLAAAGACYGIHSAYSLYEGPEGAGLVGVPVWWPFDKQHWKPKSPRENLIKALAFFTAEVEKIDRGNSKTFDLPDKNNEGSTNQV